MTICNPLDIQTWGDFLHARMRYIHFAHSEGETDAEISYIVSTDPVQIQQIRERTKP